MELDPPDYAELEHWRDALRVAPDGWALSEAVPLRDYELSSYRLSLLALIGDQFAEAGEEVCGAVVSVRSGEDVFSIWTKNDGGRNVKIRETLKRVLDLPADTVLQWKSHDDSITQRHAVDQARQEKNQQSASRRNTMAQKQEKP